MNFPADLFESLVLFIKGKSYLFDTTFSTAEFLAVLTLVGAIAATVLAFIFVIPSKKRERLNPVLKLIHDILNFKFLIIEKILQALYVLTTAICVLLGIFSIFGFTVYESYGWNGAETKLEYSGIRGILFLIIAPIIVRLIYEGLMLTLILIKNVIQINNKMKDETGKGSDPFGSMPNMREFIPARNNNARPAAPNAQQAPNFNAAPNAQQQAPNFNAAPNAQQQAPNFGFNAAPNAQQQAPGFNNGFNNPTNGGF